MRKRKAEKQTELIEMLLRLVYTWYQSDRELAEKIAVDQVIERRLEMVEERTKVFQQEMEENRKIMHDILNEIQRIRCQLSTGI